MGQTVGQYMGTTKGPVINQLPVSNAYREGCERMGWVKSDRYCPGCGRLPAFCECEPRACVYDGDDHCNHPKREE